MKKFFTLISVALTAMSLNAQTVDSYKPISVAEDGTISMASEFAAVVDADGNATNVADGKSVVLVTTEKVILEAVGGATPANVEGGIQDIEPGAVIDEEKHIYEVASVGSWSNITWKNGNNKTDINDVNNTKLYFVMGTGNPYVNMYCEYDPDSDNGMVKRASYEYYKPGMEMPQVGLYYKFTPKVDGKMRILIWANKGNRNTYLINGQTLQAVDYDAEGYVNGQRTNDETQPLYNEDGTPQLDNDGNQVYRQVQRFFSAEEIQERHNAAKVGEDGVDSAPYVIDAGNQAFWGWITFDATAGVSYWLFQDSSQVGFGGFDFTSNGDAGIAGIEAENADAPLYNLAGQRVAFGTKGLLIKNGKKYIVK